jgi:tetratricopeptide (TPR) repeat protein
VKKKLGILVAVLGSALIALSLIGSSRASANSSTKITDRQADAEVRDGISRGKNLYAAGNSLEAHGAFLVAGILAERTGSAQAAADCFNNAGVAALALQDTKHALPDFLHARQLAQALPDADVLGRVMNNLATLYLTSGHPEEAMQTAAEALDSSHAMLDVSIRPKLQLQLAAALARLHRFPEAAPIYWEAADQLMNQGDLETAVRVLATLGGDAIEANHLDAAEQAFDAALWTIRTHQLRDYSTVLRGLAKIQARKGDARSAAVLFDVALQAPRPIATRWMVYADRGEFRLSNNDPAGALSDFREARRLITLMRADTVPSDRDRVAMESGLSRVPAGLVEAGNRLARQTASKHYLEETFDAAEQDRDWSLRALIPSENDWRKGLPAVYWDLLARYQTAERGFLDKPSDALRKQATALSLELQHIEAAAASTNGNSIEPQTDSAALTRAQARLDDDSALFSFLFTAGGGWVWVVDRHNAAVYPIPPKAEIAADTALFTHALRSGSPTADPLGQKIFLELFGSVPPVFLAHKRWLLELDGPLFDVPFAALSTGEHIREEKGHPVYLAERAALEAIPGALLPQVDWSAASGAGELLAVGDAVYNAADDRLPRVGPNGMRGRVPAASLPRLPATATELHECSLAWGTAKTRILAGSDACISEVEAAIANHPSIIHFATHVLPGPDEFSSGLIALSLDRSGALGLMGPTEIVARPVTAALVVLNGCHSTQGVTLPAAGLMGLTRAWIGAGAGAVLATRWEIPDDAGNTLIATFYRELKTHWERGPAYALQHAQIELLKEREPRKVPALLGAYFLVGRV